MTESLLVRLLAPLIDSQGTPANMSSISKPNIMPSMRKCSHIAFVRNLRMPLVWLVVLSLSILLGCPAASEWDQQWKSIQDHIRAGDLFQAHAQLQTILPSIRENGPSDSRYAKIIYQLGEIALLQEDYDQAESYYWETMPLIVQSLGPEHVYMADPLEKLASIYQKKGDVKIALPLFKRALALREKNWGASDPKLLPTLKQYHVLLMLGDHHEEAVKILTRISLLD